MLMRRVWSCVLTVVVATSVCAGSVSAAEDEDYYELMKLFADTFEQIDRNYVKEVDRRELVEAAMRGMLNKLDPYSSYFDNSELKEFNEQVEQEFGGIGIQVGLDPAGRQLMVLAPIPGTPAYKAGIKAGDRIVEIDGKPTNEFGEGKEMDTAIKMMRGVPGSSVKVSVLHPGNEKPELLELERAVIKTPTVLGDHFDAKGDPSYLIEGTDKVGYIRLTHFSRNSAIEVEEALETLKKEGMKALVLDLRFNPGGLLSAATAIADLFIEDGVIVSTKGRNTDEQVATATKDGTFTGFPMVVLVNRYSASASEIVSACLQDHKRAIVVGERTWGKGSVQNVIELEGGASALKLTTASYHRPSGKNIHRFPNSKETDEWGVMPDEGYDVKFSPEEMEQYLNYRRQRDLRVESKEKPVEFEDKQLAKGLDWLKAELAKPAEAKTEGGAPDDKSAKEPAPKGQKEPGSGASLHFYKKLPWRPATHG